METLIVSVFVASTLILLYTQISRLEDSYGNSFKYNTTESLYNTNEINDYIKAEKIDILRPSLESSAKGYIDISDCENVVYQSDYSEEEYCALLYSNLKVKRALLISSNVNAVYASLKKNQETDKINESLIRFVKSIKTVDDGLYLVVEYENNTYGYVYTK